LADPEHVAVLQKGVDAWNDWRAKKVDVRPDLGDANFAGWDLVGINLSRGNLRNLKQGKNTDLAEEVSSSAHVHA